MQNRRIKKAKRPSEEGASARSYRKKSEPNWQLRRGAEGVERQQQQQQPGRAPAAPAARLAAVDIEQGYDADVGVNLALKPKSYGKLHLDLRPCSFPSGAGV